MAKESGGWVPRRSDLEHMGHVTRQREVLGGATVTMVDEALVAAAKELTNRGLLKAKY
jgi:hypothetical protein